MYAYVVQNPWTKYDPEGLRMDGQTLTTIVGGVGVVTTAPVWSVPVVIGGGAVVVGGIVYSIHENQTPAPPISGYPTSNNSGPVSGPQPPDVSPNGIVAPPTPGGESQKQANDKKSDEVGVSTPPPPQKPAENTPQKPQEQAPRAPVPTAPDAPASQAGPIDPEAGRKSSKTLRREWEEKNKKPWPKDKNGNNQDADHNVPLADGGEDNGRTNITPRPRPDHIKRHQENGDFRRWGSKRKR